VNGKEKLPQNMNSETLRKVLSDDKFVDKLLNLETGEEVKRALLEKDIVLREEDLSEFSRILGNALEKRMSDEDLSHVSGGAKERQTKKLIDIDAWVNSLFKK
jgi:hypothetical protein